MAENRAEEEMLILVDKNDNETGFSGKTEVHAKGLLHRAFSIFIINDKNEWLLQQRAETKYHSAGLWTNACCGHPVKGENTENAAIRRLNEEMGFGCDLKKLFNFTYRASFENGLTEHELDYVYLGKWNSNPLPNADEVQNWKWQSTEAVLEDIKNNPENYTFWFKAIAGKVAGSQS